MRFNWLSDYLDSINATVFYASGAQYLAQLKLQSSALVVADAFHFNLHWLHGLQQYWLSPDKLYCQVKSTSVEALEHIIIVCLVYLLVCLGIYKLTFSLATNNDADISGDNNTRKSLWQWFRIHLPEQTQMDRVLIVIAHPDDECMFFGPLIYTLTRRQCRQLYILCLSNGNFEHKGKLRRAELWHACKQLGIDASNVMLVNATNLPDDPNVEWRTDTVAKLILHTVESLEIQAIFTFDRDGISSHPNHCAVYYATASLRLANLLPKECKFFTLDSINVLRKYLSIFDLLCTCFMSTHWCVLSWRQASVIRRAMLEHKSQMKWFRWLYIYCSRYMFINSLREVNLSDVELEMQIHEN